MNGALFRFFDLSTRRELGLAGERRAAWFYRLRGFRVIARNVRIGRGEVDLIVRRGRLLVFVEVKTRRVGGYDPAEAVTREKQLQIAALAKEWCWKQRVEDCEIRFDVVALVWSVWRFHLQHYPGAFELRADEQRPWRSK